MYRMMLVDFNQQLKRIEEEEEEECVKVFFCVRLKI
jgi:hypothetical protein